MRGSDGLHLWGLRGGGIKQACKLPGRIFARKPSEQRERVAFIVCLAGPAGIKVRFARGGGGIGRSRSGCRPRTRIESCRVSLFLWKIFNFDSFQFYADWRSAWQLRKYLNASQKLFILILLYTYITKSVSEEAIFLKYWYCRSLTSRFTRKIPRKLSKAALKMTLFWYLLPTTGPARPVAAG